MSVYDDFLHRIRMELLRDRVEDPNGPAVHRVGSRERYGNGGQSQTNPGYYTARYAPYVPVGNGQYVPTAGSDYVPGSVPAAIPVGASGGATNPGMARTNPGGYGDPSAGGRLPAATGSQGRGDAGLPGMAVGNPGQPMPAMGPYPGERVPGVFQPAAIAVGQTPPPHGFDNMVRNPGAAYGPGAYGYGGPRPDYNESPPATAAVLELMRRWGMR